MSFLSRRYNPLPQRVAGLVGLRECSACRTSARPGKVCKVQVLINGAAWETSLAPADETILQGSDLVEIPTKCVYIYLFLYLFISIYKAYDSGEYPRTIQPYMVSSILGSWNFPWFVGGISIHLRVALDAVQDDQSDPECAAIQQAQKERRWQSPSRIVISCTCRSILFEVCILCIYICMYV